jgi:hypothetical protein
MVQRKCRGHVCVGFCLTKSLFDLPYRSETECMERALSFHGLKPDILLSLGGEAFSVYPMKDGMIANVISTSKCAAGTGEFIVQQLQRMGLSLEQGLEESLQGRLVQLNWPRWLPPTFCRRISPPGTSGSGSRRSPLRLWTRSKMPRGSSTTGLRRRVLVRVGTCGEIRFQEGPRRSCRPVGRTGNKRRGQPLQPSPAAVSPP